MIFLYFTNVGIKLNFGLFLPTNSRIFSLMTKSFGLFTIARRMEEKSPQQGGTAKRGLETYSLTQRGSLKLKVQLHFKVEFVVNCSVAKIVEKTARTVLNTEFGAVDGKFR